jgi:phosphoribosylaminoimidazole (AIR) synthetase
VKPLVGGFAGVMAWPGRAPLVAATMDGVGTKLHLALQAGRVADAAAVLREIPAMRHLLSAVCG